MRVAHEPTLHPWSRRRSGRHDSAPADEIVPAGVLVAIVNADGGIDAAGSFEREVGRSLDAGATRLLVDLSRADDVTNTCMNTLLAARQRLFGSGRVAVVLPPRMRIRFEALGLTRRFLIADDRLQAVRLLGLGDTGSPRTSAPRPHAHAA